MDTIMTMDTRTETSPLRAFLKLLGDALLHPTRFFREDLPRLSTSEALAFGIGNAWLAAAVAFLFQTFNSVVLAQLFEKWVQRLLASEDAFRLIEFSGKTFVYDAGAVVLLPFLMLLRLVFGTAVLYLFSRLFVEDHPSAPEPVTFNGAMRIQASSYVAQWYTVVPFFGPFLAFVVGIILQITGVRERFLVSTRRAAVVVLAPYFLVLLAGLLLTALVLFAVTQIPFQDLLDIDRLGFGFPKT
jgi:hypothetical protein